MLLQNLVFVIAAMVIAASGSIALAESAGDPTAVKSDDGKYLDKEGNPTLKVGLPSLSRYLPSSDFTAVGSPALSASAILPDAAMTIAAITKTRFCKSISLSTPFQNEPARGTSPRAGTIPDQVTAAARTP